MHPCTIARCGLALVASLVACTSLARGQQTVWYVDADAAPGGAGVSWSTAFDSIDDALDQVAVFDQVWVRAGVYSPAELTDPNDPRSATYWVPPGTVLLGGFAGNESTPEERTDRARTVLSGDLGIPGDASDNAYHVVTAYQWSGLPPLTVFDRFEIEDGNANGSLMDGQGGGMFVSNSFVLLSRCRFRRNQAVEGGALYAVLGEVQARWCTLENNAATRGGAIYGKYGQLNVFNAIVRGNTASAKGGAYFCNSTYFTPDAATFAGCTFHDNAANNGGVAYVKAHKNASAFPSHVAFLGCTLVDNAANKTGGAVFEESGLLAPKTRIAGSILWANQAGVAPELHGSPKVTHSTVSGGFPGGGNLASDPGFVDEAQNDFRLTYTSACVDAAKNSSVPADRADLDEDGNLSEPAPLDANGLTRLVGGRVDMGAYELPTD